MIETMKVLALNGPSTKWDLASKYSGKRKDGLTPFSYPLILKHINYLSKIGYVKGFGIRKKPMKHPGHPKTMKTKTIKHETTLYGVSFAGLAYTFLREKEVRTQWEAVVENYPEARLNPWLRLAKDWIDNSKLKGFPLKRKYGKIIRHYQPNARLFVQSLLFSETKEIPREYDEVIELLDKYSKGVVIPIYRFLQKERNKYRTLLERCEILLEKLEPLRYPEEEIQQDDFIDRV